MNHCPSKNVGTYPQEPFNPSVRDQNVKKRRNEGKPLQKGLDKLRSQTACVLSVIAQSLHRHQMSTCNQSDTLSSFNLAASGTDPAFNLPAAVVNSETARSKPCFLPLLKLLPASHVLTAAMLW